MSGQTTVSERTNYHCHCLRCGHASGTVRDYAGEAVKLGLAQLGFSDHLPYPDGPAGYQMPYGELEAYLGELAALRDEMAGVLPIYRGFEAEYFEWDRGYYEGLLAREDCDYLLLGQHFFMTDDGELVNSFNTPDTGMYEAYARSVVDGMRTGLYRYAAHPDLIFLNENPWDIHCERACDIIIDGAVRWGFPLECNANGIRRGKQLFPEGVRYPYPVERFWDKAASAGARAYVGSDCHSPELMWDDAVETCYEILLERGIVPETRLFPGQ